MNCKTITERLKRVAAIVDGWKAENDIPQIERDIALGELRDIYNALLVVDTKAIDAECDVEDAESLEQEIEVEVVFETPTFDDVPEEENVPEEKNEPMEENEPEETSEPVEENEPEETSEPVEESIQESSPTEDVASIESFYNALDIDALLGLTDEPSAEQTEANDEIVAESQSEVVAEPAVEPAVEPTVEPTVEPAVEPAVESIVEPVVEPIVEAKPIGAGLFDLNDIPVRSKSRRKMISLYSDNPIPVQTPAEPAKVEREVVTVEREPVVEVIPAEERVSVVEPIASQPQRLGESFGEVKTLADKMAKDGNPTTPFNRITELRQAIGLNDRFLMIRDLFGGDAARYEATIDTLDEFEDLDECIIYIVENFRWNPDLEAAKLLVSLIERKLA